MWIGKDLNIVDYHVICNLKSSLEPPSSIPISVQPGSLLRPNSSSRLSNVVNYDAEN